MTRRGIKKIQTDEYTAIHNDKKKWQGVVDGFRKISRIAAERDIPGVVVIFPLLHKFTQYPWMEVHAKVAEEAKSEGLVAFDLLPTFNGIDEKEVRIGPGDYIHPNSKGHLLAGEAVYNFLVHQDLLENANAAALSQTLKTQQAASNKRAPRQ